MIGIDLVNIPEFEKQIELGGEKLLRRAFNSKELESKDLAHLAGVWAAKESVIKAANIEISKLTDIKITYDANSKPCATVKRLRFEISIAHHGDYAVAVAKDIN